MAAFVTCAIVIFIMMNILFFSAQSSKNNSIVDNYWGIAFVIIALITLLLGENANARGLLVTILVTIWGLRLSFYLRKRNAGKGEDFRYVKMRESWTKYPALHAYFKVFMLQAVLIFLISAPVFVINLFSVSSLTLTDLIGVALWIFGFYFQAKGDKQLKNFKADPENAGKILTTGLWAKTRHPNYFGEITMWWGIFFIALGVEGWFLSLISPILITLLITKVSGIPLLEKKYADNAAYQEYASKTPRLVPRLF